MRRQEAAMRRFLRQKAVHIALILQFFAGDLPPLKKLSAFTFPFFLEPTNFAVQTNNTSYTL